MTRYTSGIPIPGVWPLYLWLRSKYVWLNVSSVNAIDMTSPKNVKPFIRVDVAVFSTKGKTLSMFKTKKKGTPLFQINRQTRVYIFKHPILKTRGPM